MTFQYYNTEAETVTSQSIELIRQCNVLLNTLLKLDPDHKLEHLARLDRMMGLKAISPDAPSPNLDHKADLLAVANAAGLDLNDKLVEVINAAEQSEVFSAIEALKKKAAQEFVNNPNGYFITVLKDRQSKTKNY